MNFGSPIAWTQCDAIPLVMNVCVSRLYCSSVVEGSPLVTDLLKDEVKML